MVEARGTGSSVSLVIPCKPEYLALGRLVAGSLGAQQGWDKEDITDLRVVVSELSSFFIAPSDELLAPRSTVPADPAAASALRLDFEVEPQAWTFVLSNPDLALRLPLETFSDPLSERSLGLTIIQALVDSVEQTDDQTDGTVFRVSKQLAAADTPED